MTVTGNNPDRDFWIAIRAAHIRRAKLLEQERACIMEEIAAIESRLGLEPNEHRRQVQLSNTDTYAGAV